MIEGLITEGNIAMDMASQKTTVTELGKSCTSDRKMKYLPRETFLLIAEAETSE